MRRSLRAIAMVFWALMVAPTHCAHAVTQDGQAKRVAGVLEKHLLPGFAALKEASAKLPSHVAAQCGGKHGNSGLLEETAGALAAVDFYRFGPLAEKGRREKLAFWPDPRGVVGRQVRQAVAARDKALLAPGAIAQQSAALQGLPALELLLSRSVAEGDPETAQYACELAHAIAVNISALSSEVYEAWTVKDGARDNMLAAGPQNGIYKSHGEAAGELLKSLLTGLQAVAELQLKPRLEKAKPPAKGPYVNQGLQRLVYASATQSLRKLYDELELEAALPPEKAWIKNWAGGTWRAIAMSDGLGGAGQGTPASAAPKLAEVVSRIGGLRMLIGKEMSNAAGIAIGFNELDGD